MQREDENQKGISRRTFLKGTALGVAGVASVSVLGGCGPDISNVKTTGPTAAAKASFEEPPAPIADKKIKSTYIADVVVAGGGTGGMFAAIAAAEAGARTILLEKAPTNAVGPAWMAAYNSRLQKKLGVKIDRDEMVAEICRYGGHLVDQRLINLWADKSGETLDWFTELAEAGGLKVVVETDVKKGFYKSYPVAHLAVAPGKIPDSFPTGAIGSVYYMPILIKRAKELGVEIYYETGLEQLIKNNSGRVTGAIAKTTTGEYLRFNANKGVILCTGGFGRNVEMLEQLCPTALDTMVNVAPLANTGDGIKAALWVGAEMDPDHAMMVFDRGVVIDGKKMGPPWQGGYLQLGSQPFLRVNTRGERFVNEDLPYDYCWDAALMQPEHVWWEVWDSNWKEDVKRFHTTICSRIVPDPGAPPRGGLELHEKEIGKFIEMGLVKKADSLEVLGKIMGVDGNTFKTTVARYNQLAHSGKDTDFGKVGFRLSTLENGPFFASKLAGMLICNLNGLRINTNLQVLDKELKPIEGLYAAGNDSGGFFAYNYPEMLGGLALGRTATFGRLAGQHAAGKIS